jgi:hypothetical protein
MQFTTRTAKDGDFMSTAMERTRNRSNSEEVIDLRSSIESAPKRSSVNDGLRKDYVCKTEYSRPQRAAHCFAWCAKNYPGTLVPWTLVCMAINAYRKAPMATSKEVVSLRQSSSSIRKVLTTYYQMDLVSGPEITARATVDDEDTAKSALPARARRVQAANRGFVQTANLINPSKIKDPELRKWVSKSINDVMKIIDDPTFYQKLLPPKV